MRGLIVGALLGGVVACGNVAPTPKASVEAKHPHWQLIPGHGAIPPATFNPDNAMYCSWDLTTQQPFCRILAPEALVHVALTTAH